MAASKLLNLRTTSIGRNLIRFPHLLQSTNSALQSISSSQIGNGDSADSPNHSSNARDLNLETSNFAVNMKLPFGYRSTMPMEAARTYVHKAPVDDDIHDLDDDDDDDEDDDVDDDYVEDYSGSELDGDDDYDGDSEPRIRSRCDRE